MMPHTVSLEVLLAAEPAAAQLADKGLGGILGERLLATTAVGRGGNRGGGRILCGVVLRLLGL